MKLVSKREFVSDIIKFGLDNNNKNLIYFSY